MQFGPSSEYAKARRPLLLVLLLAQSVACFLRCFLLLDVMGAFLMGIAIGIGYYAWREDMNITCIAYFGVLCLVNGAFDFVRFLDVWVRLPMPIFSGDLPGIVRAQHAVLLAVPLTVLPGAALAYAMYRNFVDAEDAADEHGGPLAGRGGLQAYPGYGAGSFGAPADPEAQPLRQAPAGAYDPFRGTGHRLGSG